MTAGVLTRTEYKCGRPQTKKHVILVQLSHEIKTVAHTDKPCVNAARSQLHEGTDVIYLQHFLHLLDGRSLPLFEKHGTHRSPDAQKTSQHGLTLLWHQDAFRRIFLRASLTRVQLGEKAEHMHRFWDHYQNEKSPTLLHLTSKERQRTFVDM